MSTTPLALDDLESTALLTSICHAQESRSAAPILRDPAAERIADELRPSLAASASALHRRLARGKVRRLLATYIALRSRQFDRRALAHVAAHPPGVVVDLGCGLDTRFLRIDDGRLRFFDLDLPEVIALKRSVIAENARYRMIACSVLDHRWMDEVAASAAVPPIFLAEGLFMYLPADGVRALVRELRRRFPGATLVFEAFASAWLSPLRRRLVAAKMQRQLGLGAGTAFQSGLRDAHEPETWADGIRLVGEWSFLDEPEPKLGVARLLRAVGPLRRIQWTVEYELGPGCTLRGS